MNNKSVNIALVKNIFESEQYLHVDLISDSNVRSCYTKFRISALRLEIECGRYKHIPISERLICKMCNLGKTEDEIHVMLECPKYDTIRSI